MRMSTPDQPVEIDPEDRDRVLMHLRATQRLVPAIVAGAVAALFGAAVWAAIAVFASFETAWVAIGIGVLVGVAVRLAGRGFEVRYAAIGAALALAGVVAGKFLGICGFVARHESVSFFEVLRLFPYAELVEILRANFSYGDLVYYALSVWCGWGYARRKFDESEIAAMHRRMKAET